MAADASSEYRTGCDPRTLRDALGCFATGVTVITCLDGDGQPAGLTVNSLTSVSLDPPLLLVCIATGVTVVTCLDGDGQPAGLTVNSLTSVSLDPPLLLVCIARQAASAAAFLAAGHFAINVLQTGQQPASIRFSTRHEDRFGPNDWSPGELGAPVLNQSLGVFECEAHAVHEGGDHHILLGRVIKATFDAALDPLLYFRGRYRRLHFD